MYYEVSHRIYYIGGSRGGVPGACPPPPMGPNSFVFTYIFTKKCPRRRSTPPLMAARPPYGKSWIRHCISVVASHSGLVSQRSGVRISVGKFLNLLISLKSQLGKNRKFSRTKSLKRLNQMNMQGRIQDPPWIRP